MVFLWFSYGFLWVPYLYPFLGWEIPKLNGGLELRKSIEVFRVDFAAHGAFMTPEGTIWLFNGYPLVNWDQKVV